MWIRSSIAVALVTVTITSAQNAAAQMRSSGMSAFGSGSSGFGSSGFGSSFGSSGFGSGFGSSGFGSSFGSSGFGSSFGSSGFGSNGNNGFVGRDANDMQSIFRQLGRSSTQYFNNMNRQMARGQQTTVTTRNPSQPIRTEVQVAFAAPQPSADVVAKALQVRLAKIMSEHHMTVPTVSVQNGTAVLSGVARNDNERQVIESLVSFEPGVRTVRNEMTVAGAPTSNMSAPPGS
jgi:hypothetical protein